MNKSSPFTSGNPVQGVNFIGRSKEMRRLRNRLISGLQSSAVVGEPRSGKTSMLLEIQNDKFIKDIFNHQNRRLIFSYIDLHTKPKDYNPHDFWRDALAGLRNIPEAIDMTQEELSSDHLESIFLHLRNSNIYLVVEIDEFDVILHRECLNCSSFLASLRSFATRSGALATIIATRSSLNDLEKRSNKSDHKGSPYFNYLEGIVLGAMRDVEAYSIIYLGGDKFALNDQIFLHSTTGNHPFLLQIACTACWDLSENHADKSEIFDNIAGLLFDEIDSTFRESWDSWEAEIKSALVILFISKNENLSDGPRFESDEASRLLTSYQPELIYLCKRGYVKRDQSQLPGWSINIPLLNAWIAMELMRITRDDISLDLWIKDQELYGVMTNGEVSTLKRYAAKLFELYGGDVKKFIKHYLEGLIANAL